MNISERLSAANDYPQIQIWEEIAKYVGENPQRLDELMDVFFSDDPKLVMRSGQIVGKIADKNPLLTSPYTERMIQHLRTNPSDGFKRNALKCFQKGPIPQDERSEGELFDFCLLAMQSMEEAIAVKAFAMTVARRICERYPELASEVILPIEILVEENYSAGVVSKGKKELKKLQKLL